MKKISIILIAAALLFLAGCGSTQLTPEQQAQATLDQSTLQQALSSQNLDLCGIIKDEKTKNICELTIKEQQIEAKIVLAKDLSGCKKLTIETLRERCEITLNEAAKTQAGYDQDQKGLEQAVASRNAEACDKLQYEHYQSKCRYKIYMTLAQEKKDPKICDNIDNKESADLCKQIVGANNTAK